MDVPVLPLFLFLLALAIGTGGVGLWLSIAVFNKLAGGQQSSHVVPQPSLIKAVGVFLVACMANALVKFGLSVAAGTGRAEGADPFQAQTSADWVFVPVSLVVMTALLSAMLPTTLMRAVFVTVCFLVVIIPLAVAFFYVAGAIVGATLPKNF